MSTNPSIEKNPALKPSEDYYLLRRKGIEYIEQMGSEQWTDYNAHDPGITLLEALCYAITDLGYRTGWDIKDLLAKPLFASPSPGQPFFTAREALTCNPLTINDFRKILIDLEGIRNAWLICKDCPCETEIYADCEASSLAFLPPPKPKKSLMVVPLGTYDTLLELEQDAELGDLNDRKITLSFNIKFKPLGKPVQLGKLTVEARFPRWNDVVNGPFYHRDASNLLVPNFDWTQISQVVLGKFSRSKTDVNTITEDELHTKWNEVFYTTVEVYFSGSAPVSPVIFENVAMRFFATSDDAKNAATVADLQGQLTDISHDGTIVKQFFRKEEMVVKMVEQAKNALAAQRNLCEDFCCTDRVCTEDVAVCADVELTSDADIERVLANILFEIEDYFNPPVPFYSLREMQESGLPTEQIFEGPMLNHGFIKADELDAAGLKTLLRTSDIVNRLMDIEGVVAVKNLLLTRYDADGNPVKGVSDGGLNKQQISAKWTLAITDRCQPRLYALLSKFLFFKNELPFLARMDEVQDTLTVLRGNAERPKITAAEMDLPVPMGEFRSPEDYFPVQYSLPLTYGVGFEGLPERATSLRRAQAKQLKAFLLFFEQLLGNYIAQLANVGKLFSMDPSVDRTYFTFNLRSENLIKGVSELMDVALVTPDGSGFSPLDRLAESQPEYLDRRNRFLDHLLGRFAESFTDYALALYSWKDNAALTQEKLISDKIAFLQDYPVLSRERAKALDYRFPNQPGNFPGLRRRIARLLGFDVPTEEKIIIVEHLLLRPKFAGDALMGVCLDKTCQSCGEEDPYSFQMTVVMPGFEQPFNENLEMRRFADRTIRMETPAHILVKICWVGNQGYAFDPCHPSVVELAKFFSLNAINGDGKRPALEQACGCAEAVFKLYDPVFQAWIAPRLTDHFLPAAVKAALAIEFDNTIKPADLASLGCGVDLVSLHGNVQSFMVAHFSSIALNGLQYDKFITAWTAWLDADKGFDWCELAIQRQVKSAMEVLVKARLDAEPPQVANRLEINALQCGCEVLERFGQAFFDWQKSYFDSPESVERRSDLEVLMGVFGAAFPDGIYCGSIKLGKEGEEALRDLLVALHADLFEVTHRLWLLLDLLGKLTSVYPPATLHDCDEGSDVNPVKLGSTALGGGL
jgi:hypothetical protein